MCCAEGCDLSVDFHLPVIVGHDAHLVANLPPVRIVRIVLAKTFGAGFGRDGEGFVGGHFLSEPVSTARMWFSHAATCLRPAKILSTPAIACSSFAEGLSALPDIHVGAYVGKAEIPEQPLPSVAELRLIQPSWARI